MRSAITVVVALMLGCAHVGVRDLGDGRYALTAVASSGGYYGSHEEAEDSPAIGPQGEHTSDAVFSCAAPPRLHF